LDLRGRKGQETGEDCIMRSFMTCTLHHIVIRVIKSRRMRWTVHVVRMEETRNVYSNLVGKPEGKRQLRRRS